METIITKVRQLIADNLVTYRDIFTYEASKIFTLSEPNVVAIVDVYRNDVTSAVIHAYNTSTKKVTISSTLTSGDTVEVEYTTYLNYSDTELTNYIQSALTYISLSGYFDFTYDSATDEIYPTPDNREENLIAMIASLIINPDNKSIRLPDISISNPEKLSLSDKIGKIIGTFKRSSNEGIFDLL